MIATQYFSTEKPQLKTLQEFVPKVELQYHHRANYNCITLVSREIADTISHFVDKNLISKKDVAYFESLANGDNDYLFNEYKKKGKEQNLYGDFEFVISFFNRLGEKSLSEFQRNCDLLLPQILSVIFQMRYVEINVVPLNTMVGKAPEKNVMRIISEKQEELKTLFLEKYKPYTNNPNFNFAKYDNLFHKLKTANRETFIEIFNQ